MFVIDGYPETKLESAGYYYDSFPRPLLDDVIWEVHFHCALALLVREIAVGIRL